MITMTMKQYRKMSDQMRGPMTTEQKKTELPALPCGKPHNSKYWDEGIEWNVAGERAVRMEREDQLRAALTRIEELTEQVEKMPKWKDVSVDLPQQDQVVLCFNAYFRADIQDAWSVQRFWGEREFDHDGREFTLRCATHWQPLPSPPAEGDQG